MSTITFFQRNKNVLRVYRVLFLISDIVKVHLLMLIYADKCINFSTFWSTWIYWSVYPLQSQKTTTTRNKKNYLRKCVVVFILLFSVFFSSFLSLFSRKFILKCPNPTLCVAIFLQKKIYTKNLVNSWQRFINLTSVYDLML